MASPRSDYLETGGHELHVTLWGEAERPALFMWHGLARTGRDFDEAAEALSERYFVICPDTLGRGLSSWATDPARDYAYRCYGDHAQAIVERYGIGDLRWVGTSMGGLIGVTLAADRMRDRISHLVVNDIGPEIPQAAASRIADYVGNPPVFDTIGELESWLRANYATFGDNSDAFWRRMADTSARRTDSGKITVHYDPSIVNQFTIHAQDLQCWPAWDRLQAKTLLLRGAESDVLPAATAEEMSRRVLRTRLIQIEGYGHAPTLTTAAEIALLRDFLES